MPRWRKSESLRSKIRQFSGAPAIPASSYRISLEVPAAAAAAFETALAPLGGVIVTGVAEAGSVLPLQVYLARRPARRSVAALIEAGAAAAAVPAPAFVIDALPDIDWVAESQKALPAVRAGRFYLRGSHVAGPPPAGSLELRVEAATAFGTGHHESTRGCLLALSAPSGRRPVRRALDMGCGTGVLAMAIARRWRCPVLAVDSDPESVRVARANAVVNGVAALVRVVRGAGYRSRVVREQGPYDLIAANILAAPLAAMATDLHRHLAPGGFSVLSGLLAEQQRQVLAPHLDKGLRLGRRILLGDWATLVLQR